MNYLTVENISKSYGELTLFENISFSIHKDQKVAFVAKNGTGKTSILNILEKNDEPDTGNVIFRKDIKVSFLPQEPYLNSELTVEDTIFNSDNPILDIIKNYEKALLNPEDEDAYQADNTKGWYANKTNDTGNPQVTYEWNGTAWIAL